MSVIRLKIEAFLPCTAEVNKKAFFPEFIYVLLLSFVNILLLQQQLLSG